MKMIKRKKILLISIIIIIITMASGFLIFKDYNKDSNDTYNDSTKSNYDDDGNLILYPKEKDKTSFKFNDNKIIVSNYYIEDVNGKVSLSLLLENVADTDIDLSNGYKLMVYDKDDNVINIVGGQTLGLIKAKNKTICNMILNNNFKEIYSVKIIKNSM